ncbi:MAG: nodulation protein NfeD [Deltaproteobacteria bacterium]|nr:nodulation protein NfeD [Deltaproteobacteria bacterium]
MKMGLLKKLVLQGFVLGWTWGLQAEPSQIIRLKIEGGINPAAQRLIERGIERAQAVKAEAILIELNTPGGLLTSTRAIVQRMFDSEIPVLVYVAPSGAHAGSAGVMITLASHVAAMAPGTNIGAAHPVSGSGQDIEGHMAEKVTNDTAAWIESIAKTRGRNEKWAIEAVRKSVSIDHEKALKLNVIDHVAPSSNALLEMIHGKSIQMKNNQTHVFSTKDFEWVPLEFSFQEKLIDTLSDPNIAYILMMIGMVGLYIELSHPGVIFPGVIGAISLILSFVCLQALPINYGGLALLLLGLALLITEIFIPSFGILGIGGLISLFLGSIFLIDPSGTDLTISLGIILPTVLSVGGIMLFISVYVVKALRGKSTVGSSALIGKEGEVIRAIEPHKAGKVFVYGDYWNAESDEVLKEKDIIVVTKVENNMVLMVKKKEG